MVEHFEQNFTISVVLFPQGLFYSWVDKEHSPTLALLKSSCVYKSLQILLKYKFLLVGLGWGLRVCISQVSWLTWVLQVYQPHFG